MAPRDPRPGSDGPAAFFLDANYDLTASSAAIDTALTGFEPTYDFLYRSRVPIAGRGFPGTGPGDIGAFEFRGVGGLAVGGAFRVASTSLTGDGSPIANGRPVTLSVLGNNVLVDFSGPVDPSTVTPSDLVLSGNGLDPTNPAHATSLNWIDSHTVQFLLSGAFKSTGTVNVSIPAGAVQNTYHQPMLGFSDSVQIANAPTASAPTAIAQAPTPTATSPAPATSPTHAGKHKAAKHHPVKKHTVIHHPKVQVHHPKPKHKKG